MNIFQALVYGIVQGLGEFLPISSTAHITLVPWLFGWQDPGLAFDIALHIGTLFAVVMFFWKDWLTLISAGIKGIGTRNGRLFWFLVLATLPGGLAGVLFESRIESSFRNPALIGVMLIVMGIVLYLADKIGRMDVDIENIGLPRSVFIGISQALSIIPGVSRSGITMAAGRSTGLKRDVSARFSFLLSTPIIFASAAYKIKDIANTSVDAFPFVIAVLTSAIVGVLSIKFLLDYLRKKGFGIFVIYRFILGIIVIGLFLIR